MCDVAPTINARAFMALSIMTILNNRSLVMFYGHDLDVYMHKIQQHDNTCSSTPEYGVLQYETYNKHTYAKTGRLRFVMSYDWYFLQKILRVSMYLSF